jgi:hypothetical protein
MRSPAAAFAWEFRERHRYGLMALAGYVLVMGAVKLAIFGLEPLNLDDSRALAAVVVVPFTTTFMYFLGVFTFGFEGDLAARESMYPRRLFSMPVRTEALAGWPMLYGGLAVAALALVATSFVRWEVTDVLGRFALRPFGVEAPLIWPAVLGAVFLAWTQAFAWMPYGLRGLRVIITVFWLIALDAIMILAFEYEMSERALLAFLLPQLPLAYLAARFAVARARRGDVPDWREGLASLARILTGSARERAAFSSPEKAQLWFEWRLHGRSLPVWIGILLPFELALLLVLPELVDQTLLAVLLTPPFMASFAGATVARNSPSTRDSYGLGTFTSVRPLSSATLGLAKLKVAVLSTLAAWALVLAAIPLALAVSGTHTAVIEKFGRGVDAFGALRMTVAVLSLVGVLMLSTFRQLVQSLCIGLTGREWIIKSTVLVALSFLVVIQPVAIWINRDRKVLGTLLDALPWVLAILALAKVSAAAWMATRLFDNRLLKDRTLVASAAAWLLSVLALFAALAWFWDTPHVAPYFLLLIAILQVPLVRVSAVPLSLAWNRHR